MENFFWKQQPDTMIQEYIQYLKVIGSLSNLFSDSTNPYLYYRAHENLFCQVFEAKDLSRGDVSYDATKDNMGIGLKTFLNGNGKTFQKVAEFNSDSFLIRNLDTAEEIVHMVAELRNKRIKLTQKITGINDSIYHIVTRERGKMNVVETIMNPIDIDSIRLNSAQNRNTIKFSDRYNDYSFSLSKNTLLKRFDTSASEIITQFNVDILDNPFEYLTRNLVLTEQVVQPVPEEEYIILPLYSPKLNAVAEKSGLNQWKAGGRGRNHDEVYIPIPRWIYRSFEDFFVYNPARDGKSAKNSPSFAVELPNKEVLSCRVTQENGKGLMSDPNKALGEWLLRDVLQVPEGTLVTMEVLQEVGIDSVKLTKKKDGYYYLDFMETGSFELFEENNNK